MWTQAKIKFRQLLFDDSGIAMAYTIVTFLVFFMICISTYAMSENIRRKMELQNACDAAAYSAAVVQADMLSRIAVLNRALSWTYAETSKRHMDCIVADWVTNIINKWDHYQKNATFFGSWSETFHREVRHGLVVTTESETLSWDLAGKLGVPNCHIDACGSVGGHGKSPNYEGRGLYGWFMGWNSCDEVKLNENDSNIVSIKDLNSALANAKESLTDLSRKINLGNTNIDIINKELSHLRHNINNYISSIVEMTFNTNFAGVSLMYFVDGQWGNNTNSASYLIFENDREKREDNLLAYIGKDAAEFDTGSGINGWWVIETDANGIRRKYNQGTSVLTAKFRYWATFWSPDPFVGGACHHWHDTVSGTVENIVPTCAERYSMNFAYPQKLADSYWRKAGSIIVAAQINSTNPLTVLFGNGGIYSQDLYFGRKLLAVSAARAGIRLNIDRDRVKDDSQYEGFYRVFLPNGSSLSGYTNSVWNLCEDDWDAVMLPIQYAWSDATAADSTFTDKTANQILSEVYKKFNPSGDHPSDVNGVMWH